MNEVYDPPTCADKAHKPGCPGAAGGDHEPRRVRIINPLSSLYGMIGYVDRVTGEHDGVAIVQLSLAFGENEVEEA